MSSVNLHLLLCLWRWRILTAVLLIRAESFGLNTDCVLLLSFKYNVLSDPFGVLRNWNHNDATPCSWNGVSCGTPGSADAYFRVTGLSLPGSGLLVSIPSTLGAIEHLRNLNLSSNSINGSIPASLFNASQLQTLDFSNNSISGELPGFGNLRNIRVLNLSDNAMAGNLPASLAALTNLTAISLKNNYFSGSIPGGFSSIQFLDLSSNLINGSLPADFGGSNLVYLNISFNRLSGDIPAKFAATVPVNATIDISNNNFTGPIPDVGPGKAGSSPCPLPWEMRLKIAKGVALGLCYIHEKKQVHGNLKPNNILLGWDMEPKIGDFGLQHLITYDIGSSKAGGSARNFGSKRSTASRDSFQDYTSGATPSPSPSIIGVSPYHAPESLRSLKPNPKWDVFSLLNMDQ